MLIAGGQLGGADASARVRLAAGKIDVSDGPFPEAKELAHLNDTDLLDSKEIYIREKPCQ
jgi:hypothetical protein